MSKGKTLYLTDPRVVGENTALKLELTKSFPNRSLILAEVDTCNETSETFWNCVSSHSTIVKKQKMFDPYKELYCSCIRQKLKNFRIMSTSES